MANETKARSPKVSSWKRLQQAGRYMAALQQVERELQGKPQDLVTQRFLVLTDLNIAVSDFIENETKQVGLYYQKRPVLHSDYAHTIRYHVSDAASKDDHLIRKELPAFLAHFGEKQIAAQIVGKGDVECCKAVIPKIREQTYKACLAVEQINGWINVAHTLKEVEKRSDKKFRDRVYSTYRIHLLILCELERYMEVLALSAQLQLTWPDDWKFYEIVNDSLFKLGWRQEAETMRLAGLPFAPEAVQQAEGLFLWLRSCAKQEEYRQQLAICEKRLQQAPGGISRQQEKMHCLMILGRRQEALDACRQLLVLDPQTPERYQEYGAMLFQVGRKQEAVQAYLTALAMDPSLGVARNRLKQIIAIDYSAYHARRREFGKVSFFQTCPSEVVGLIGQYTGDPLDIIELKPPLRRHPAT